MERNDAGDAAVEQVQRLCSEIQLFDLCELERCGHKNGRFCSNEDLVARFERISEREYRIEPREDRSDDEDGDGYDDGYDEGVEEGYGEDDDRWDDD
jgi:hypothetical protein